LSARIRLVVLEVVPYPLSLDRPDVPLPFTHQRFRTLAESVPIETKVDLHLVRDPDKALDFILEPRSVIIIGGRCPWWPTAQGRSAKRLKRKGHIVVYAA
jgi:hypothetical protein